MEVQDVVVGVIGMTLIVQAVTCLVDCGLGRG